jgi:2-oxoglutarate ferredoxin oxidoreductase subunit beta
VKLANPDLDVWVVTGDGDGLSIGGNHLVHLLRRNLDVQLLLFNNEIYGLTKGQASPTSRLGTRSPSTPRGSIDPALVPATFALGAGARFVARAIDTQQAGLVEVLKRAHAHRGTSFVEIYQNCVVFNDGVFDEFTAKDVAPERQLHVEHGKPMLFGKDRNHGIRMKPGTLALEVVTLGENGVGVSDVLVHDQANRLMAQMLAALRPPEFPVALGVLYDDPAPSYEVQLGALLARDQVAGSLESVLRGSQTWSVEE